MQRSRPVFRLGLLRMEGDALQFQPDPHLEFTARAGEEVDVLVAFEYREASHEREDLHAVLTIESPGMPTERVEHRVEDRPVLNDDVRGVLLHTARFPSPGDHTATYRVEAVARLGKWEDGEPSRERHLTRAGRFLVRVR
ncbi:MAG TPA: hypothetical protein VNZ52_01435 [Candidatus Thermoplasmatota archaeon]|nr:hypothetical protein [Candidatus Thermoplasmatota archaeon]